MNICIYLSMCTLHLQIIPKFMLYMILPQPNRVKNSKKDRHFVYVEILNKIMCYVAQFHIDLWTYLIGLIGPLGADVTVNST
jgi:hypothetical protein